MNGMCDALETVSEIDDSGEAVFRVVLSVHDGQRAVRRIHQVVGRVRGDLRRLSHSDHGHRVRLSLQLGIRRIDDVVTALEAAGFDVTAVVATRRRVAAGAAETSD